MTKVLTLVNFLLALSSSRSFLSASSNSANKLQKRTSLEISSSPENLLPVDASKVADANRILSKLGRKIFSISGGSIQPNLVAETLPELKPPPQMFANAVATGEKKALLSPAKTLLLGIISGCHIAFGAYLLLSVGGNCPEIAASNPGLQKIIMGAFGLPFGLMMTLIGGGELFTGNTAMLTAAFVEKRASGSNVLKNWFLSYTGNFIGSLLMAWLAFASGTLGASPTAAAVAVAKTSIPFLPAFIRGLLCNWLVSMAVYMANGASSLPGKMTAIFFPISAFVALGLEHSVANMFLIPLGMLRMGTSNSVSVADFLLKNILPVTLGNMVGGILCVAGAYSAAYGSLLDKTTENSRAAASLNSLRGGFAPPKSKLVPSIARKPLEASTTGPKIGSDFLPPQTLERAAAGNMFEKVKLKKDGTSAWTEVHEYAEAIRSGKINWEDIASDDMDIRLKYAGLFHRKKATPGKFMMRLRIPNGIVTSDQMRYYATAVRPYGPEIGVVDITTRQNIQLRGMPVEGGSDIIKGLNALNQTSLMSGLDNVRNMVGSPIAGIDPHELIDTRQITKDLDNWYTNYSKGNIEWGNLPRKFNIAVSGSRDDFAHTHINDIGLQPVAHSVTGEIGFNIVLGGYMSIKRVAESVPMDAWIPASDAVSLCDTILRIFRDEGGRQDRQKARLMWLVEEKGLPAFREAVESGMKKGRPLERAQTQTTEWTLGHRHLLGIHPQKQAEKSFVGIHVPVGRLSADECEEIAALADKYSAGEIRLTVEQNVILPNVDNSVLESLKAEPAVAKGKRLSIFPSNILSDVISCTGAQFCPVAIVETKYNIDKITRRLDELVECPHPVRIHMTGCPNSCGQVQVADIGLMGAPAKKADETGAMKAVPGVNVFVGGKIGEHPFLAIDPILKGIPFTEEDLIPVLTKLLIERHEAKMR